MDSSLKTNLKLNFHAENNFKSFREQLIVLFIQFLMSHYEKKYYRPSKELFGKDLGQFIMVANYKTFAPRKKIFIFDLYLHKSVSIPLSNFFFLLNFCPKSSG